MATTSRTGYRLRLTGYSATPNVSSTFYVEIEASGPSSKKTRASSPGEAQRNPGVRQEGGKSDACVRSVSRSWRAIFINLRTVLAPNGNRGLSVASPVNEKPRPL